MDKVLQGKYNLNGSEWNKVSKEGKNMVKRLLTYEPKNRVTAREALQDKWILKYNVKQNLDVQTLIQAYDNIKKYKAQTELQEQAYAFIVNFLTSRDEKAKLMKVFQCLDVDGDGLLSRQEIFDGYRKVFSQ